MRPRLTSTTSEDSALLLLEIPRTNDKKELAAEQMLAALHGILQPRRERRGRMQEHISLEIAAIGQRIRFYIWTPRSLQAFVEGQIYAQYPTVQISEVTEDYSARNLTQPVIYSSELVLSEHETMPIKTFPSFEVDPLAAITATLAKLDQQDEEMWLQIMARPIDDSWHKLGTRKIAKIKSGSAFSGIGGTTLNVMGQAIAALVRSPTDAPTKASGEADLSERDKSRITAIQEKGVKLGYQVKIRMVYAGPNEVIARQRMQALVGTFKQFNSTNLNGFTSKISSFSRTKVDEYKARHFIDKGYILNVEELASLFHLPHTTVETPNIVWAMAKTAEPPSNVPTRENYAETDVSLFGVTNFRGSNTVFGIDRFDRSRHMYIIGQTGTGKSGLLELLTLSDIYYDQGFAVIDPHGDYAQSMLRFIPERRINDVIYFNPVDSNFPIGFNPLEITDPAFKTNISSEIIGVLKRMFGESWGPRLEYILRYTLLALLDYPNTTMLDIPRILTEKNFRAEVMKYVEDPVVRSFWTIEFASWNDKFAAEAIAPVLNKVGAFTANPLIRNIIGQPQSTFNIRKMMDEGKILLVNLSKGQIGEDNASILGALLVTKIQLAAMSRANLSKDERRPFYLYVDEFQNYATDSFATILSEARKYALNLTVANQYISQMLEPVRDAVFGNVGTVISFRVGVEDAPLLTKYFEPQFEPQDLSTQANRHFLSTMTIKGEKSIPFSGTTLNIPTPQTDFSAEIITNTRQNYGSNREAVEQYIRETALAMVPGAQNKGGGGQGGGKSHGKGGSGGGQGQHQGGQSQNQQPAQQSSAQKPQATQAPAQGQTPQNPAAMGNVGQSVVQAALNGPQASPQAQAQHQQQDQSSTQPEPQPQAISAAPASAHETPTGTSGDATQESEAPKKRKRTRSRRKKKGAAADSGSEAAKAPKKPQPEATDKGSEEPKAAPVPPQSNPNGHFQDNEVVSLH